MIEAPRGWQQRSRFILLLVGNYVSLNARSIEPFATLLGRVPARLGRFAVLGK